MFQNVVNFFKGSAEPAREILGYVDTVHAAGGYDTPAARDFLENRKEDAQLQKRAEVFNQLWDLKQEVLPQIPSVG